MRKVATSLGFGAIGFALAPVYLTERADGATGLLLAVGLFTIAIAAVIRE
jgi:hypothetical protein